MGKINVLVVPSDNQGGVGFYRSVQPHIQLEKQFPDDFHVEINMNPDFADFQSFDKYNIIHIHKGLYHESKMPIFRALLQYCKTKGIVTVMDIDDFWELHMHHPMFYSQRYLKSDKIITENLKLFDYVTTTTPIFANEIKKYNKNVYVLPNAIDPTDPRFAVNKKDSPFVRIGMIMGSTHEHDAALMNGISNLPSDVLEKIQFVLCGYDLRGSVKEYNRATGESTERPIKPEESVWYRYEQMMTDNYRIVSPEYKDFLLKFIPNAQYPNVENEHYKRCWTKDMNHYYEHFSEIDVLLAPLEETPFNKVKSQLKVIEAAFSHCAIIASNFGPYTIDLHSAIEKGGTINKDGNAILIDMAKNHKDWRKYITKVVKEPELLKQLQENLYRDIHEKYDLRTVTKERAELYKKIVNK